jgi:hypothetical protein
MIKLIGRVKESNSVIILNIYSKNISEKVLEMQNKISIKNYKDGILIQPNGKIHATIAQNKRIQVAITKLIREGIIDSKHIKNKEISVYINSSEWGLKEIIQKSIHILPLSKDIPGDLMEKRAAIRLNNKKYYLDISSKRLYELAKKEGIKCLFNTDDKNIVIIKSNLPEARKLTPHSKKRIQISIPKKILDGEKIIALNKKGWLPVIIQLNLNSFRLEVSDFYSVKEENELVKYLSKNGVKVAIKDYTDPFDIKILDRNTVIEVHNSTPDKADFASRHKVRIGQVRLRILEADYSIKNRSANKFFLILNSLWQNNRYISELKVENRVHILFTDFRDKWYERIGKDIINLLA